MATYGEVKCLPTKQLFTTKSHHKKTRFTADRMPDLAEDARFGFCPMDDTLLVQQFNSTKRVNNRPNQIAVCVNNCL